MFFCIPHNWKLEAMQSVIGILECDYTICLYQCSKCGKLKTRKIAGRFKIKKEKENIDESMETIPRGKEDRDRQISRDE